MQMDWSDLALRLIRFLGAVTSAVAGIAALLTDGAFTTRKRPIETGFWKHSPFAKYKVSPWGGKLLAVILIAPTVQFLGDWVKDSNDSKTLHATAGQIQKDINGTVKASTEAARLNIVDSVSKVTTKQEILGGTTDNIAMSAGTILTNVNRTLYPFKDIAWAYRIRVNLNHPAMEYFRELLREKMKESLEQFHTDDETNRFFEVFYVPTDDKAAKIWNPQSDRPLLVMGADSHFLDPAGDLISRVLHVDIFKSDPPTFPELSRRYKLLRSTDYAVTITSPKDGAPSKMAQNSSGEPPSPPYFYDDVEVDYVPAEKNSPDSDQCFIYYYWRFPRSFNEATLKAETTIAGLADLANSSIVVRLENDSELFGGANPTFELDMIKMYAGTQELTLSRTDLGKPVELGGYSIFKIKMPTDFPSILHLLATDRSLEGKTKMP